jgi:hypothetical protein
MSARYEIVIPINELVYNDDDDDDNDDDNHVSCT